MIQTKTDLRYYLDCDGKHYPKQSGGIFAKWKNILATNPINSTYYLWKYIKELRVNEYHLMNSKLSGKQGWSAICHSIMLVLSNLRLVRLCHKTGFQIPPTTCREGLCIYHYGSIIVNQDTRIGKNATLFPGVVIGDKDGYCPVIGDNVTILSGAKLFGNIKVGNNVTIGVNAVVNKDVPDNVVVGGIPAKIIKDLNK